MQEQHIPGLSVAVVKEGRIVLAKGYGWANVESKVAATPETVYPLASLTKQFTATAIMLLVQDGKLGLDDKISRYLDYTPPNWKDVTIRQLLTHSSGIKDYLNEMNSSTRNGTNPEEIVAGIGQMPLNFTPGSQAFYSNTGYLVLGIIIKRASGKSYDEFLAERVFKPLGMRQTRRDSPDDIILNRAAGYVWWGNKLHNSPYVHPTLYDNADAGLISSVTDLARWDAALYRNNLLTDSSRAQMGSPVKLSDGVTRAYGFGWLLEEVNGHKLLYHNGNRVDTSTFIGRFVDDKLTVIVLTNLSDANPTRIGRYIAGLYLPALKPAANQAIADTEPQITDLVQMVLLKIQAGTVTADAFTPEMWSGFQPNALRYVQNLLTTAGALKSITLLARKEESRGRTYRYRVVCGDTSFSIECLLTKDNKISEMGISKE